jgi:hypothetical protein
MRLLDGSVLLGGNDCADRVSVAGVQNPFLISDTNGGGIPECSIILDGDIVHTLVLRPHWNQVEQLLDGEPTSRVHGLAGLEEDHAHQRSLTHCNPDRTDLLRQAKEAIMPRIEDIVRERSVIPLSPSGSKEAGFVRPKR